MLQGGPVLLHHLDQHQLHLALEQLVLAGGQVHLSEQLLVDHHLPQSRTGGVHHDLEVVRQDLD